MNLGVFHTASVTLLPNEGDLSRPSLTKPSPRAQDCPVECAAIFHERMKRIMKQWVYINGGKQKGLFGRIKDYVLRYEVQDRG